MDKNRELFHHGILGMKWGIRRTPEQLGHRRPKPRKTADGKIGTYNTKGHVTSANYGITKSKLAKGNNSYNKLSDKTSDNKSSKLSSKSTKAISAAEILKNVTAKDKRLNESYENHKRIIEKAKREGKSAAQIEQEEGTKESFHLSDKQKKAIKIGAAVAISALAIYGAYKYSQIKNEKIDPSEILERGRRQKSDFLKEAFGDGDYHAFSASQHDKKNSK